jgi:LacI family transcriptional regulator
MATIKDVAEHSGISIKTVSRVINGAQTVRPKVREKVEASIRALNYRPLWPRGNWPAGAVSSSP